MKTKNKMLAMLEIAIVLCSAFLMAIPAIAAEQNQEMQGVSANTITTASEDDYVLGVYGNANEDDTIDMRDLTYVKLIFFGKKPETELADAKYDGKINPLDFIQIKLIIVGKEKELTLIDSMDRTVMVHKPIERIVTTHGHHIETMRALKLGMDKIVGVSRWTFTTKVFFPEFSEENNIGGGPYDTEKILSLRPDIVMIYTTSGTSHAEVDEVSNKLKSAGIAVVRIDCYKINNYVEEIRKLGYILDKKDEAEEFIDFYEQQMNTIIEKIEGISEEDRPKVYFESYKPYRTCGKGSCSCLEIEMAGGNTIFDDTPGSSFYVDPEAVIDHDPEIIITQRWPLGGYSTTDIAELKTLRDEIMNRPELATVTAVKTRNVYVIGSCFLCKPVRFVGLAYMAKWFHPDLFEDLDPQAIHQEYLDRFHKDLNFNVYEDAVFVYSPLAS